MHVSNLDVGGGEFADQRLFDNERKQLNENSGALDHGERGARNIEEYVEPCYCYQ